MSTVSELSREERPSRMVLTVTEDTPADMLAGSMELLVQLPRDNNSHTQRVTVQRSTPMMDLLVQIATAHKLAASSYTLQAIGERGLVLPHQPNTPIGALDALQVKLLPKQGTFLPRKTKQANQPFETTFRLQVHLPRNQLYVSRVSPKMNLGEILDEVCREKNLDRNKYELRHPANLEETLDLSLSLQDYHLQEVTLYAKQGRSLGSALSTQDIMALQRQEERRRQQAKQGVFGFIFKKSKESSLSTDSLGGRSVSPARSDETGRSASPLAPPARPQRKRRPAPKPPVQMPPASTTNNNNNNNANDNKDKDKMVISHSRNSSDSSGYHEASVLSDNPDSAAARLPETLPRRSRIPNGQDTPRKLAQTSQASKSLGNLAVASGSLGHAVSSTSLSSTGLRKKRAAPPPPVARPLSSAISTQALERIVDSEESLTSDMDPSKPPSDIGAPSKASSDIDVPSKANSDLGIGTLTERQSRIDTNLRGSSPREPEVEETVRESENSRKAEQRSFQKPDVVPVDDPAKIERSRVTPKRVGEVAPLPAPRKTGPETSLSAHPVVPKRRYPPSAAPRTSRPASQVSASDETASDTCLRDSPAREREIQGERVDRTVKLADEKMKGGLAEADVARKDGGERRIESFSEVGAADEMSKVQGNDVEESDEFVTFGGGEKRREVKGIGAECSKDLHTENIGGMSSVEDAKERKCEDSNMKNVAEEMKRTMVENSEDSTVRNYGEYVTEVKGNDMQISQEDIEREDKDNEVNGAMNINDDDISIAKNNHIDAEKAKLTVNNRTYSTEIDAESSQQQPTIIHAINNKVVGSSYKTQSLDTEMETEKCKNNKKSKEVSFRAMRQAKSMNDIHNVDYDSQEKISPMKSKPDDKKSCMIVSTIPKCDHFDIPGHDMRKQENHESLQRACLLKSRTLSMDDLKERKKMVDVENEKDAGKCNSEVPSPRRTKICRSQSEFRDFEESSFKKQRKHLTSHAQDFAFALNLNLPATQPKESLMRDADRENSHVTLTGRSEKSENLSETDILLQKVSDTLSSTLPASSSPVPEVEKPTSCSTEERRAEILESSQPRAATATKKIVNSKDEPQRSKKVCATSNETNPNVNSPNATINSQQDTSDYVSAMSEDLSITDWEYQLPDPPSAFRDSNSPVMDGYDTITLRSVDAFQETQGSDAVQGHAEKDRRDFSSANAPIRSESFADKSQREVKTPHLKEESRMVTKDVQRAMKTESRSPVKRSNSESRPQPKTASNLELKKEVISELENKIETGCLPAGKEPDFRKAIDSTPAIAPVENPLSNFTITTYTRQKSLNIFEEVQEQQNAPVVNKLDERVIKTFATLSRNKTLTDNPAEKYSVKNNGGSNGFESKKTETKEQARGELTNRWQAINGEKELHSQQQQRNNPDDVKRDIEKNENIKNSRHDNVSKSEGIHEKKCATVLTTDKEKFALWRDNILNRQEEPTKEKQLQSIQVLKSILPQLKQTQQTEENVSEKSNKLQEKKRLEMRSNEHSADPNIVSTEESQAESEQRTSTSKERIKQYIYTGPPAISLGSWSERPCVNVQIKMDTDYKFGKSNTSGTRTLVNLNSRDQTDSANKANEEESSSRVQEPARMSQDVKRTIPSQPSTLERKEPDEFTRKLITHTTATGFKKPMLNKVSAVESKPKSEEKPVVMGVELKKSFAERQDVTVNSNGNEIDTTPVNFKELTKTFGQEVCFRTKPKRVNQNRLSDYYGTSVKLAEHGNKQNGHVADQTNDPMKSNSVENGTDNANHLRTRRYTSVVGINNSLNQSFGQQAANRSARNNVKSTKINQPMPVVKGFNFQREIRSNAHGNQNGFNTADSIKKDLQKPSTVPVITGVTLKSASARPKSMPVSVDQRDILLESIRNFGGSKKLKSVAARY